MTGTGFLENLKKSKLLSDKELEFPALKEAARDPAALASALVKTGRLTRYQVKQIASGDVDRLRLGGYILLDRLGEGAMGEVCLASHLEHGRVALKILRRAKLANPAAIKRFAQEMELAAQLDHPHIVRAIDWGQADGSLYLAMEYVEGPDLSRLVKQAGPLPISTACQYARQAALALHYAHERGIIHRDMKPANLIIGKDASARLLDLGLARLDTAPGNTALTQLGQMIGTPDYLAPEQAIDPRRADARSDIYGLGCTLFYLVAGKPPFAATSLADLLLKHQSEEARSLRSFRPDAPEWLVQLLGWMMNKRPEDRPQTAREVAEKIAELNPDLRPPPPPPLPPVPAPPDPWAGLPEKPIKRRGGGWLRVGLITLLVASVAVGATLALWPATPKNHDHQKAGEGREHKKHSKPEAPKTPVAPPKKNKTKQASVPKVEPGNDTASLTGHRGSAGLLVVSADGKLAATAGSDKKIILWDLTRQAELWKHNAGEVVRELLFGKDKLFARTGNKLLAWTLDRGKAVEQGGKAEYLLGGLKLKVRADKTSSFVRVGNEERELAAGGIKGDPVSYHAKSRDILAVVKAEGRFQVEIWREGGSRATIKSKTKPTRAIWGAGGEVLFGDTNGQVWLCASPKDEPRLVLKGLDGPVSLALSADGKYLLAAGKQRFVLFDLADPARSLWLKGNVQAIRAVGFGLGGTLALAADKNGKLHIWELAKLK